MTPIYFPFTYIPRPKAAMLSGILGPVTVLQPVGEDQPAALRQMAADGLIDIRVPYAADQESLRRCLADFKAWGQLHHGAETSLSDFFKSGFSQESFTAQIRTDILKDVEKDAPAPDPLFLARLFLMMAQELDVKQTEIALELASSQSAEKDLFARMTGESDDAGRNADDLLKNDFGAHQPGSRIAAWFRIFETMAAEYPLLVTDSRRAMEAVLDKITGFEKVRTFEQIPDRLPEAIIPAFVRGLTDLAVTPWETGASSSVADQITLPDPGAGASTEKKIRFHLYGLPHVSPADLCRRMSGRATVAKSGSQRPDIGPFNTIMGFIEI
jgi:hypothetical protein